MNDDESELSDYPGGEEEMDGIGEEDMGEEMDEDFGETG